MDLEKLSHLVAILRHSLFKDKRQVEVLDQKLQTADIVAPDLVPKDVIRMESRFRVQDVDNGKEEQYTLVFPEKADISKGRISILAPVGTALLGHAAGDLVDANVPAGNRTLQIEQVFYRRAPKKTGASEIDRTPMNAHRKSQIPDIAA